MTVKDSRLYLWLDELHLQVLRAKHRLRENPDREALADIVATELPFCVRQVEAAWRAYEAAQP